MEITEDMVRARIAELEQARDRLIEQANLELARILARLDELRRFLHVEPDPPADAGLDG